ncbi:MAG: hypothetical protein GX663_00135 [Clostridiales bacterium]|nr:hypothetical protein [Clostridiales bacterium]
MMTVTFPNFGPAALVLSKVLRELGVSHIAPRPNDEEALRLGIRFSPEEICIPFKYMVGNLIKAYEEGADTVLMAATSGPCRLGEYCELLKVVLDRSGYEFNWIVFETPNVIGMREFIRRIKSGFAGTEVKAHRAATSVAKGLFLTFAMDRLKGRTEALAGYITTPYKAVRLINDVEREIEDCPDLWGSLRIISKYKKVLYELKRVPKADPIRILLVGEIYTSMEREANGGIEETLMMMGCSVTKHMDMTWWIRHTAGEAVLPKALRRNDRKGIICEIGGYGKATVSEILKGKKIDGIVKIMPSGCMPEIVTKSYCEMLQEEKGYRILHLIYDEMSGNAGYETRLEAFVDMLERRRDVLAGNRHRIHKHGLCNDR